MIKLKGRRRMCAYTKAKDFLKSRLLHSVSRPDAASIPHKVSRIFTPPQKDERFERTLDISIRNGDGEAWSGLTHGVGLFDTQCEHNLVTAQFLKNIGFKWQPSTEDTDIIQMDNTKIECLGEVRGRWHPVDAPKGTKDLNFRPRYEMSTFKVVDLDTCDLIIGRTTMIDLKLLQINRNFFGAFRQLPIRVDSSTTIKKQQEADERRKKEQEEMRTQGQSPLPQSPLATPECQFSNHHRVTDFTTLGRYWKYVFESLQKATNSIYATGYHSKGRGRRRKRQDCARMPAEGT
ncbi:hypothetical protein GGP41_003538 [Bipolaris sorokiniana]|uniref:Uncharacterized protein n=1 Tax=Cochliobolus sativus TaxID=45130 RepID=A0A8H5ZDH2_COCSA|nr:hypothetical protein GGP41_003538 [Bipolaris sorokiniana]